MKNIKIILSLILVIFAIRIVNAEELVNGNFKVVVDKNGSGVFDKVFMNNQTINSFDTLTDNAGKCNISSDVIAKQKKALAESCSIKEDKDSVVIENGFVRAKILNGKGGVIEEIINKITGQKCGSFSFGMEVNWSGVNLEKTPCKMQIEKNDANEIKITIDSDVGKDKDKVIVSRIFSLKKGRPWLGLVFKSTAVGDQNVKMTPVLSPVAGKEKETNDNYYIMNVGLMEHFAFDPVRATMEANFAIIEPVDNWAATCDLGEKTGIGMSYTGGIAMAQIDSKVNTIETKSAYAEPLKAGTSLDMIFTFVPFVGMNHVCLVSKECVIGMDGLPEKVGNKFTTNISCISDSVGQKIINLRLLTLDNKEIKVFPAVTVAGNPGLPVVSSLNLDFSDVLGGEYKLEISVAADKKEIGKSFIQVYKVPRKGVFVDVMNNIPDNTGTQFSVLSDKVRIEGGVTGVSAAGNAINISGELKKGKEINWPFTVAIEKTAKPGEFLLTHTLDLPAAAQGVKIGAIGIEIPILLGKNNFHIKTTCSGERINDMWRLDQFDEGYPYWLMSDNTRWPIWRFGGLHINSSTHYVVWKAGGKFVRPVITDQGTKSSGWVDASCLEWGVTACMEDAGKVYEKAIFVDGKNQTLSLYFYPPFAQPLTLASSGVAASPSTADLAGIVPGRKSINKIRLKFHEGSVPSMITPELSLEGYTKLVQAVPGGEHFHHIGLQESNGRERIAKELYFRDIQPSTFVRNLITFSNSDTIKPFCSKNGITFKTDKEALIADIVKSFVSSGKK
ncbi:MAG: hypothetical protein A2452_00265 [Candidatus Firestonebacteria bacterium RIFOXYC2_FULL_39_67]|nr:MAG: hypothetical protein A2536_05970 [Candidatus Firestonebacteria bacterium RIFOXYD2_FULL_39_29]OGF54237.1 MAG: hypothetical protein A2452_00265 [Candidatus Firestonebacteria bacterium RIFOXYC2_FULL_39_67]